MNDLQFDTALTAAGLWFFISEYETISSWKGDKQELLNILYKEGFDSDITGTRTRLNAVERIIDGGRVKEALEKVMNSSRVIKDHPDAAILAKNLLSKM